MLTLSGLVGILSIAALEGAMVAAPRAGALARLERFRSPAWAAVLPAAIVFGTFAVLALPRVAPALVFIAFVGTPLLAGVAALSVVKGARFALVASTVAAAIVCIAAGGWAGQLAQTLLTALGCLAAGAVLVRLIPRSWLPVGVISMCAIDVALLGVGIGQPAGSLMAMAASHIHAPILDRASVGPISTDYPDLVLAAVLGSALAGEPAQRRAAVLVAGLAAGYGMLLPFVGALPATVPLAVVFVVLRRRPELRRIRRRPATEREAATIVPGRALAPAVQEAPA